MIMIIIVIIVIVQGKNVRHIGQGDRTDVHYSKKGLMDGRRAYERKNANCTTCKAKQPNARLIACIIIIIIIIIDYHHRKSLLG